MKRVLSVGFGVLAGFISAGSATAADLKAGVGAAEIQFTPAMLPIEGYTSQHDPISSRVLLLDSGSLRIAMLVVDTPSIQDPIIERWKGILGRVDGVRPENTLVIASHDTSAPHVSPPGSAPRPADGAGAPGHSGQGNGSGQGGPANGRPGAGPTAQAYAKAVDDSIESAATKALVTLQPVQLGFGIGTSRINTNRDVLTPKGWAIGYDDSGFIDPSLAIVRLNKTNGAPLAWLMDYAVRPAVLEQSIDGKDGKAISGDLVDSSEHYLEAHSTPGGTAIFMMGAGVDQTPYLMANRFVMDREGNTSRVDLHEAGFTLVDLLSERLGSEAVRVSDGIKSYATPSTLRIVRQNVDVVSQLSSLNNGPSVGAGGEPTKVPFVLIQIGDLAIVGIAPELNARIGVKMKAESPFPHTVVVTMVDGSAKYLPDTVSYDRRTPASLASRYARGSAENAANQMVKALKQMHDTPELHVVPAPE